MRTGFCRAGADFYGVSCDYLLGRTADKSGAVIAVEEIPENDPSIRDNRGGVLPVLNKKLVINSINIVFDLLQRCNNKALTTEVSAYLTLAVYTVFRQLYTANPKNPVALFSVESYMFQPAVSGELARTAAVIGQLAAGRDVKSDKGLDPERAPSIVPDDISRNYPLLPLPCSIFCATRNLGWAEPKYEKFEWRKSFSFAPPFYFSAFCSGS